MIRTQAHPLQKIPADLYEALLTHRKVGEKILWCGQPDRRRTLRLNSRLFWICIPLLLLVADILWIPFNDFTILLRVLCAVIALPAAGLTLWSFLDAHRTAYAVTNQRLLIACPWGRKTVVIDFTPTAFYETTSIELPDGSGDLCYTKPDNLSNGDGLYSASRGSFIGIPNVREVEALIRDTFGHSQLGITPVFQRRG